jgi:UDP-GlcNAc:undecaprenyl-phosphate GlcNAc-1-phosphate transferase
MGDTGSQFLGALLAYIGIKYYWNLPNLANIQSIELQFMFPALGFLIPILDTSIVTVARLRRGQSPFVGGRDHLTHHLSYLGIPDKLIPLVLGIASIVSALLVLSLLVYIPQGITGLLYISAGYVLAVSATFITLYQVGLKRKKLREQNSLNVHTDQQKKQKVAVTA